MWPSHIGMPILFETYHTNRLLDCEDRFSRDAEDAIQKENMRSHGFWGQKGHINPSFDDERDRKKKSVGCSEKKDGNGKTGKTCPSAAICDWKDVGRPGSVAMPMPRIGQPIRENARMPAPLPPRLQRVISRASRRTTSPVDGNNDRDDPAVSREVSSWRGSCCWLPVFLKSSGLIR